MYRRRRRPASRRRAATARDEVLPESSVAIPRLPTQPPQSEVNVVVAENWCCTSAKVIDFSYIWTIDHFSFYRGGTGEVMKSSIFSSRTMDTVKWRLKFSPNGLDEESKDYVSLYLLLESSNKSELRAKFKFSILDINREERETVESHQAFRFVPGKDWGFKDFVPTDILLDKSDELLPEDKLTIFCEVRVLETAVDISGQNNRLLFDVPECRLPEDLGDLLESGRFSDIVLSANGRQFQAHKAILSARSPVFAAMFQHKMKEESQVEIADMDPYVLHELLRFIYTGQAPNLENMADALIAAADKYALERLKTMCEEALCMKLSVERAAEVLVLADLHNAAHLKAYTMDFISSTHAMEVVETAGWKTMIERQPHLIAETFQALARQQKMPMGPLRKRITPF
ncbi:hypothetical protein MTO96_009149 [Rhipicephalus appendiculatus]